MGAETKIEWCDKTFNPWSGCTKISPACDNCYAAAWAERFRVAKWGPGEARVRTTEANWRLPLKWDREAAKAGTRPRVFCASLADVFDNEVPVEWVVDLLDLIRVTPYLTWLLLTKRIGNWRNLVNSALNASDSFWLREWIAFWISGSPPNNVWLGATICNQEEADRDVPKLLEIPAAVRFVSIEPMLGPIDVRQYLSRSNMPGIDWAVVGGESGPHARPSNTDWLRSLRDQCASAEAAFFVKQMGGVRNKRGALDDIPDDLRIRRFPS